MIMYFDPFEVSSRQFTVMEFFLDLRVDFFDTPFREERVSSFTKRGSPDRRE